MAVSPALQHYLDEQFTEYDLISHSPTSSTIDSAQAAHISAEQLAKAIVLKDETGAYLMAVVPAANKIKISLLSYMLKRKLSMVHEWELRQLFQDCEPGAIPALGQAYGLEIVWDDQLMNSEDIYFESGDHCQLVHISKDQFQTLMDNYLHDAISCERTNH